MTLLLSSIIIIILFSSSWFLRILNKNIQNEYYGQKNELIGREANPHIVIVEIDEKSFDTIGRYPFPRSVYAQALTNIQKYAPASVAFDLQFLDPSVPEEDASFSAALEQSSNVILGAGSQTDQRIIDAPYFSHPKYGFLFPNVDVSNKTVYTFSPQYQDVNGKIHEHFSLQILRSFYSSLYRESLFSEPGYFTENSYVFSSQRRFPLASQSSEEILINFIDAEKFTRISFWDLLDPKTLQELNENIDFKDKIILIGPASASLKDEFFTPNGVEYGVYIHANILNTLLGKKFMMYFDMRLEWMLLFFLILLSVSVNFSESRKVLLWSNLGIIGIFWLLFPLSIFLGTNLILNYPSEIIFSWVLSVWSANIVKYLREDKNKQRLNKALSEYVGTNIAQEILFEEGKVNLDGEQRNLLYFFSDIEGFTHLSEKLSPQELVAFLREYLTLMTSGIMESGWYIDKFEGDAIMAFWGAFSPLESVSYISLCESALAQQKALIWLNLKWKEKFGYELSVRMGLHGGEAIVGNIWALGKKMDFTALGDNVNLASRLEGVNKFYGTYICASEEIYQSTKEVYLYRFLDEIQVVWKEESVKIYELLGKREEASPELQEKVKRFTEARELYVQKKFQQATAIFQELQAAWDIPSQTYITRCEHFLANPPEADWNGVWKMMEK